MKLKYNENKDNINTNIMPDRYWVKPSMINAKKVVCSLSCSHTKQENTPSQSSSDTKRENTPCLSSSCLTRRSTKNEGNTNIDSYLRGNNTGKIFFPTLLCNPIKNGIRIFVLLCSMLIIPDIANATCIGGEIFSLRDGSKICVSNKSMPWWAAFQWCEAQGMKLPTIDELCNYNGQTWQSSNNCPNLAFPKLIWVWTATASPLYDDKSYRVYNTQIQHEPRTAANPVVCK